MNTPSRLGLILIIGAVEVALILIFTQNSGQKPSITGTPLMTAFPEVSPGATLTAAASPKVSPGATLIAAVSPMPLASATPTAKPNPTKLIIQHPTEIPYSWISVTASITATATELKVGDDITITVTLKHTGQRAIGFAYCILHGYVNYPELQLFEDPILSPAAQHADVPGAIVPGKDVTCTFGLKAVRLGTVWLEGGYGGKVYVSDYERDIGENSSLLQIHVGPANP